MANKVQDIGYSDLDGRPAFKMSIRELKGIGIFTLGFLASGWSIVDVIDPSTPYVVKFISGPENTFTLHMELSDNIMITALEKIFPNFGGSPSKPFDEVVLI